MKPFQGIRLFQHLLADCLHCCRPHRSPSLVKRVGHMTALSSLRYKYLLSTVKPALSFNDWPRRYHQDFRALWGHETVRKYLETLKEEFQQVNQLLISGSMNEYDRSILSRRHTHLSTLVATLQEIKEAKREVQELEAMCADLDSKDEQQLLELALEEKEIINQKINTFWKKIFHSIVPWDKHDESNVILEVTTGRTTGGDICQQFTREVFEMYQNYAAYKRWTFEILNYTPNGYGGLHHATAYILGDCVYRYLKYEGGIHRVQRIPEFGLSSRMQRIHSGTMSVIVLPLPGETDFKVHPKDLQIDTFKAKGAGGQHVNSTDSAVRITHIPSGLAVECQQKRSQKLNKEIALQTLRTKLYQQVMEKDLSQMENARKLQLGTRDQSERIRTYNFCQDRVTDHRISYDVRNIKEFLCGQGELDKLINMLLEFADMEALIQHLENINSLEKER
uniref:Mitochondrial translation release factor 1 n=1 Tax=Pelusios castaneus TaxID=367368 RepID=A0A8C8RXJ6_9SAUR